MTLSDECISALPTPRIPVPAGSLNAAGSRNAYAAYDPRIREARGAVSAAALLSGALDPLTVELVRLRNGWLQGCHF